MRIHPDLGEPLSPPLVLSTNATGELWHVTDGRIPGTEHARKAICGAHNFVLHASYGHPDYSRQVICEYCRAHMVMLVLNGTLATREWWGR